MTLVAALAAFLAAAPPAAAPSAAAPPPPAVELARLALPRENWDALLASTRQQIEQSMGQAMEQSVRQAGGAVPPGLVEHMQTEMADGFETLLPAYEEILDFQAGLLQKHFTAAELEALLAFYRSPLGVKIVRVQPEVMRDAMAWMQHTLQQRMPPFMEHVMASTRAWMEANGTAAGGGVK